MRVRRLTHVEVSTHHFLLEVLCKPLLQGRKKTFLRSRLCIARGGTGRAAGLSPRGRLSQGAAVATAEQREGHHKTLQMARNEQRLVHVPPYDVLFFLSAENVAVNLIAGRQIVM